MKINRNGKASALTDKQFEELLMRSAPRLDALGTQRYTAVVSVRHSS